MMMMMMRVAGTVLTGVLKNGGGAEALATPAPAPAPVPAPAGWGSFF